MENNEVEVLHSAEEIKMRYQNVGWKLIRDLVDDLLAKGIPYGHKMKFKGKTASKVDNKEFWVDSDDRSADEFMCFSLVPNKPRHLYNADLRDPQFIIDLYKSAYDALNAYLCAKEVDDWIAEGKPCTYTYGWHWKGAGRRPITKEKAAELRPRYSFGKGFYTLSWITVNGVRTLDFNELSENDMW